MSQIRLQKYIADCGVTSRRKAEDLIVEGKVLSRYAYFEIIKVNLP